MPVRIAVSAAQPQLELSAQAIAQQLKLPLTQHPEDFEYILILTPQYLGLLKTGVNMLPLHINFLSGKITYRRQHASLRHEALARALGLNHQTTPSIVDATAGLAQDSFILASLGFDIQLIERSPIICALLQDGIDRAAANVHVNPIVKRLHLIRSNAISWLENRIDQRPDLIYLDPMFPEREKSALVKKEMRMLQEMIGEDLDADVLLKTALACASKRVVVKRPRLADPIPGPPPSFSLKGRSSRFDIYLTRV